MSGHDTPLSRLEPVDLREIWESESTDFTPWLAEEENLALLGEAIGIDLELEATEKDVGPFRADMLCKETGGNERVVIENQLEPTNHDHLGKVITYSAGLRARTLVWIAKQFTDEHRAALDWLNQVAGERLLVFGIEIELWRIGDSRYAPRFNVVCRPNDWSERVAEIGEGRFSDLKMLQQEYWGGLRALLLDRKSAAKPMKARPQNYMHFAIGGGSQFWMGAEMSTRGKWIRVYIGCGGDEAPLPFQLLEKEKLAIEKDIGCALEWEERPGKKNKYISLKKEGVDPAKRDDWSNQQLWLAEKAEAFHKAFVPRIKRIREAGLDEELTPDEERNDGVVDASQPSP